ncbi:MAG: histidine--tRNA ligase [Verrucomicrobia bacterium]|nr:histidine--tRNA ligase [Verrucomicrobiota bacterium]
MEHSIAKGVFDILPLSLDEEEKWKESPRWQYIEAVMRETAREYGFGEIRTPLFEPTSLFVRSVGEASDIVSKEMYTFLDRGERSLTLRPEGTAAVMRAYIEKKLYARPGIHKFFYIGPMFRYERPQKGRFRQHHQFGAEALGNPSPEQDAELIDFVCELYRRFQLKHLSVQINSIGDIASRMAYREALTGFLEPQLAALSAESQVRFTKNILRILDSKDPNDQALLQGAPQILDYLTPDAKLHFETLLRMLDALEISYVINPKLVRGLDYYNNTVFEITSGELGAQNSVGGGGRYDTLSETLGGPPIPAAGFSIGMERLLQTMLGQQAPFPTPAHPLLFLIPVGARALSYAVPLIAKLRHAKIPCEIDLSRKKIQAGLQMASHIGAEYVLVLGDDELASQKAELKHMATRQTQTLLLTDLLQILKQIQDHARL